MGAGPRGPEAGRRTHRLWRRLSREPAYTPALLTSGAIYSRVEGCPPHAGEVAIPLASAYSRPVTTPNGDQMPPDTPQGPQGGGGVAKPLVENYHPRALQSGNAGQEQRHSRFTQLPSTLESVTAFLLCSECRSSADLRSQPPGGSRERGQPGSGQGLPSPWLLASSPEDRVGTGCPPGLMASSEMSLRDPGRPEGDVGGLGIFSRRKQQVLEKFFYILKTSGFFKCGVGRRSLRMRAHELSLVSD